MDKALETSNTSLLQDNTTLENVLRYHVSPSWNEEWYNNYQMDTWVSDRQIRLNSYVIKKRTHGFSHHWTAQCSPIIKSNLKSDNGVVHIVDKVLLPPKGTIIDVLKADGRFSDFVRYIEDAGMSETLEKEGPFTLFAFTDREYKIWNVFGRFDYTPVVKGMVGDHIVNDLLCCAGISDGRNEDKNIQSYSRYRHLNLFKNSSTITVRKGKIVECDIMATNGVIHVFDNRYYPNIY